MSLPQLRAEMVRRHSSGEDDTATRLEWFVRLLLPLSGMAFGAFAAAIGLREGERGGLGGRLAVGVLAALILYLGQQIVLNAALVAGLGPLVAAATPIILVGLLALALLGRAS
jgi:lipopolysaccharide export LptBFGC system permease protein LptF